VTAPDMVTLECPEAGCDYVASGAPNGANSAKMQIGRHRAAKHGYRNPKRKAGARPTSDELLENPVRVLHSVAEAGSGRGTPTEAKLTEALGTGLSGASIAVAAWLAETDRSIPHGMAGEQERDDVVQNLMLPQDAAEALARPIAKALAPTKINRRYGRGVVDNIGVIDSAIDIYRLFLRYRMYFELRRESSPAHVSVAGPPPAQVAGPPPAAPMGDAGAAGAAPAFVPPAMIFEQQQPMYIPQPPMNVTPDIPADYVPIVPGGHVMSAHEIRR
jgi:hypothetical protein